MNHVLDSYFQRFTAIQLQTLKEMHSILQAALPDAEECISYGMPAFRMSAVLVYFAGNAHHVGFYPTSSGISAFKKELGKWKFSKGAIQFPYEQKLPRRLIKRIANMRRKEVEGSAKKKCLLKSDIRTSKRYDAAIQKIEIVILKSGLPKPALRALIDHDIQTVKSLRTFDDSALLSMHGIGPKALHIIKRLIHSHS
ncbi:MAG: DUF1801 domain-containing protein [Candidatus Kapaibacteriota bacterium]